MKVVLLNGSPRENGCTYTALSIVAKELEANGVGAEILHIAKEGFTKDDVSAVAAKCLEADGMVIGSPVWYASSCGLSNYFCDLLFNQISGKMRLKFAAAVASCRRGGASATFDQINKYFTISEMCVVGSNYWNQVHGNTPEEVLKDEEGCQTMRVLGANMAWLVKAAAAYDGPKPEPGRKVRTNFIR